MKWQFEWCIAAAESPENWLRIVLLALLLFSSASHSTRTSVLFLTAHCIHSDIASVLIPLILPASAMATLEKDHMAVDESPRSAAATGEKQHEQQGIRSYYQSKLDELELVLRDKTQNLRRLEAQRNALNAKGEREWGLR